ncbi:deformed epidermal autoregulatory factor 1 homolog [Acanthaster planci]|uniref:Deformed epidermal autoregulatory factor 1 homolog n=1 Tax=Acanthaster planci TaxID=133434 RepID=A0A8B7ZP27_ACAPL|nr:deformed epidermal autoregulatory factor 1 homolog [Acanthaster planci]
MENTEACEVTEVPVGIAEAGNIDIHNVAEELPNAADDSAFNAGATDHSNENSGDGHDEGITTSSVTDEVFHPHPVHPVGILTAVPGAGGRTTRLVAIVQDSQHHAHLVDGLKTPATPCTPGTPSGDKRQHYAWDEVVHSPNGILPVRCRNVSAELHKNKLGSGGKGRCIKYQDTWYTPSEFENFCGRGNSKDWKRSIRYGGRTLNCLIEEGILTPHAASCTCGACCDDESVESSQSGPVRLFVPYKRRKRNESESLPPTPTMKKKMKLKDAPEETRSISLDSTASQLDVTGANLVLSPMPPGTPKAAGTSDLEHEHWWQLEEMANQLAQNVQQLKTLIEQAKAHSQASKETAVLHTKIMLDAEKKEALSKARLEAQMQFSRAMMEAKAEKDSAVAQALAQARAEKMEAVANAKTTHLIKACVNCGREALSECMGCHQVSYCSSFCQRKDWVSHQHNCGQQGVLASCPVEQQEGQEDENTSIENKDPDE